MQVSAELMWNPRVKKGLKQVPDTILYHVAKQTLDMSVPMIPMSNLKNHAGTLRRSSMSGGVRGSSGDYYIGSYTDYASYVWKMSGVQWTTPGTNNKWFARTLKKHGKTIVDNATKQAFRKELQ